jgi:hypothetical protein
VGPFADTPTNLLLTFSDNVEVCNFRTTSNPSIIPVREGLLTARPESANSLQTETSQIAVSNGWVTDAKNRQNKLE